MSTSASKSQANQSSTTVDKRVAADGGSIVLGDGATLEQVSDEIAIKAIEETASTAKEVTGDSLTFAGDVFDQGVDVVGQAIAGVTDTVQTNARLAESLSTVAITNLEKNKRDADADTIQTVAKYAAAAVAVGAVAYALRRK